MLEICLYVTRTYPLRFCHDFPQSQDKRRLAVKKGHGPFSPVTKVGRKDSDSSPNGSFAQQQPLECAPQVSSQETKLGGVKFTLIRLCSHSSFAFNTQEPFCPRKDLRHSRFLWAVLPALYRAAVPTSAATSSGQTTTTTEPASDKCATDGKWLN